MNGSSLYNLLHSRDIHSSLFITESTLFITESTSNIKLLWEGNGRGFVKIYVMCMEIEKCIRKENGVY